MKRGPTIINTTRYSTRFLRSLLARVHRQIAKTEGPLQSWRWLRIEVDVGKSRQHVDGCRGHATLSGSHMHLFLRLVRSQVVKDADGHAVELPDARDRRMRGLSGFRRERVEQPVKTRDAAWLIYHELMHNYGYKHGKFINASPADLDMICKGLPGVLPTKPERSKVDLVSRRVAQQVAREAKAAMMLTYWQRRLKAAQRKVKDYARRTRYYQRQAAARAAGGPVGTGPAPGQTTLLKEVR